MKPLDSSRRVVMLMLTEAIVVIFSVMEFLLKENAWLREDFHLFSENTMFKLVA